MTTANEPTIQSILKSVRTWAQQPAQKLPDDAKRLKRGLKLIKDADKDLWQVEIKAHVEQYFAEHLRKNSIVPPCVTDEPNGPEMGWNHAFGSDVSVFTPAQFLVAVFEEIKAAETVYGWMLDFIPDYQRREFSRDAVSSFNWFNKYVGRLREHRERHESNTELGNNECNHLYGPALSRERTLSAVRFYEKVSSHISLTEF